MLFFGVCFLIYFKKARPAKISEKQTFLTPDTQTYVCVSGVKKCLFFRNFGLFCFLETPVLRFALLPYYRSIQLRQPSQMRTLLVVSFICVQTSRKRFNHLACRYSIIMVRSLLFIYE